MRMQSLLKRLVRFLFEGPGDSFFEGPGDILLCYVTQNEFLDGSMDLILGRSLEVSGPEVPPDSIAAYRRAEFYQESERRLFKVPNLSLFRGQGIHGCLTQVHKFVNEKVARAPQEIEVEKPQNVTAP